MVSAAACPVKAVLALVLLAGCFWRSYGPQVVTHTEVLVGIARKGADLVGSGRLTAESMPELTYPLERAVAFAEKARARAGAAPPASLVAFEALIASYRGFVDALDRARREQEPSAARATLAAPLAEVESAGRRVREAVEAERRA